MSNPILHLEQLAVRYGDTRALNQITAKWGGGALGLLGPNGAGKSTLLRSILGLVQAEAGRITVLGENAGISGVDVRRKIGYMPERDCWIEGLSAVS